MHLSELREKCKRQSDYIITLFVTNEISLVLTKIFLKSKITPNQVTLFSIISGLFCCIFYSFGYFLFGSIFLFISHILDCTDGNLARAKETFSTYGRLLDYAGNRFVEVFIFLGVSLYFFKNGNSIIQVILPIIDSQLLLLYYYIVDIALSLGISSTEQKITSIKFKGVYVKWGLMEPAIYGFIILSPLGFLKLHIILILFLVIFGLLFQFYKLFKLNLFSDK